MGWCKIYWNSSFVDSSSFLNFFFYRARITETGGVGGVGRLEVEYAILDFHWNSSIAYSTSKKIILLSLNLEVEFTRLDFHVAFFFIILIHVSQNICCGGH